MNRAEGSQAKAEGDDEKDKPLATPESLTKGIQADVVLLGGVAEERNDFPAWLIWIPCVSADSKHAKLMWPRKVIGESSRTLKRREDESILNSV